MQGRRGEAALEFSSRTLTFGEIDDRSNRVAALLGALPLALGRGTGSELRQPLGYTMVGGLILSQALTLFTTPVIYLYLDELSLRFKRRRRQKHPDTPALDAPPRPGEHAVPPLEGAT